MNSPKELDDAWEEGYVEGWKSFRHTDPFIPPRPQSHPMGTNDAAPYYRGLGFKKGVEDAQISR